MSLFMYNSSCMPFKKNLLVFHKRIEGFLNIHFQRHITTKLTLGNVSIVNKSPLLLRDNTHSNNSECVCQYFSNNFKLKVRQSYWTELTHRLCPCHVRNKNYQLELILGVKTPVIKIFLNRLNNIRIHNIPKILVEVTAKTIRTRGTVPIKVKNRSLNFITPGKPQETTIILFRNHTRNRPSQ